MKKIDFSGFALYGKNNNGTYMLLSLIRGNGFSDYRMAMEDCYERWGKRLPSLMDIVVCTYPVNKDCYDMENPIFHAKYIDTEHEFDRDEFQYQYYGI